ncbi:MAG: Polyprenol monophosphomannose synthase [Candidatus Omnitrophica bacterium]|nr:Polyprenol monophosphomannose synthase [Candidatus Omnitrophota bacterium]
MSVELSVIIPAYNEEERLENTLSEVDAYLDTRPYAAEILVIDDGSTDGTPEILRRLSAAMPRLRVMTHRINSGKGLAVKDGIREARGRLCLFLDADGSTPMSEWDAFEKAFAAGARAVIASRHLPGSRIVRPQPPARRILGTGYRNLCKGLFGLRCSDFNCGYKAYETALAKEVYAEVEMLDWTFDVEVMARLRRRGVRVVELPVTWRHCDKRSGLPPVRTAVRMLSSLARLRRTLGGR